MATFVDPVADAAKAYEGLRGLSHATRTFEDPADMYRVLGEVSRSVRLLRQVLDQLSRAHARHRDIAFTDERVPAEALALAATDKLHQAAYSLDEVADREMRAHEVKRSGFCSASVLQRRLGCVGGCVRLLFLVGCGS
ncbi:hypothetical protein [Schaalia hyovaginalis]|uniref:hypothetical protein n=1 Tax=Schaalia hyovaginalis TaxID=29316 RepID=UPI002A81254D|nr:hypothetical protein [Schaalia hyovaginalis]MDY4491642.1 hypothetical protein [Schaalia hyovaginalis]